MNYSDTIVAIATGHNNSGIGVIRISGDSSLNIIYKMTAAPLTPRFASYRKLYGSQSEFLDDVLVLYFKSPQSFTGEDVVEIHGHGNRILLQNIIDTIINFGARHARPGEFTERAFLNKKIDLIQAEAIADIISAGSVSALKAAQQSMSGVFSDRINVILSKIYYARSLCEVSIDFVDDINNYDFSSKIYSIICDIKLEIDTLLLESNKGQVLSKIPTVVLFGKPNTGKSTLLNFLAKNDIAIVDSVAGTTRDILSCIVHYNNLEFNVIDTAGIHATINQVEIEGIKRAKSAFINADLVLFLAEASESIQDSISYLQSTINYSEKNIFLIKTKFDLINFQINKSDILSSEKFFIKIFFISALTGYGLNDFESYIINFLSDKYQEAPFLARNRHINILNNISNILTILISSYHQLNFELMAEDLRNITTLFGEITGLVTTDDILSNIFSNFCIGK